MAKPMKHTLMIYLAVATATCGQAQYAFANFADIFKALQQCLQQCQ